MKYRMMKLAEISCVLILAGYGQNWSNVWLRVFELNIFEMDWIIVNMNEKETKLKQIKDVKNKSPVVQSLVSLNKGILSC